MTCRFIVASLWLGLLAVLGFAFSAPAWAQLTIQGAGGDARPFQLALPPLAGDETTQSGTLQSLLIEDFRLSGLFQLVATDEKINPNTATTTAFQGRSEFLMVGRIEPSNSADATIRTYQRIAIIRLFDVSRGTELEGLRVTFDTRQIAIAAHQMADAVTERLTGIRVGFNQLLALVVKNGRQYDIMISDILGKNSHSVMRSTNPIISLSWSPDGKRLAYASFENGPSQVFIQNVASGERTIINGAFESMSSPAWSPDGRKIAFAGYARGKTAIYDYDIASRTITTLADEGSINTEPVYSHDGLLFFSSGRGTSPQIYQMSLADKKVERVSFDQRYCIRPSVAKTQPLMSFLNREGAGLTLYNWQTRESREVPLTDRADSAALSPSGRLIAVSVARGKRFQTIITNPRGSYARLIDIPAQQFYEPTWRP